MQGQVLPERSTITPVYAGIDVCKDWLDVYLHPIGQSLRVANTRDGILRLKRMWTSPVKVEGFSDRLNRSGERHDQEEWQAAGI
jgi:transposase